MSNLLKHDYEYVLHFQKHTSVFKQCLTGEQLWEFSVFDGFSWHLLEAVDLSSVLESEADAESEDAGFLRLLFIPDDKRHSDVTG